MFLRRFFVSKKEFEALQKEFDALQQRLSVLEVKEQKRQDQENREESKLESARKQVEALIEGSIGDLDREQTEKSLTAHILPSFHDEDWKIIKQAVVAKEDGSLYAPIPKVKPRKVSRVRKTNKERK